MKYISYYAYLVYRDEHDQIKIGWHAVKNYYVCHISVAQKMGQEIFIMLLN